MITALYCVLNEEEFIWRSLMSVVPWVQETIVVDCGSTDGTRDICRQEPIVRLVDSPGKFIDVGQCQVRNFALSLVTTPWVLIIDGDEIMADGWRDQIEPILTTAAGAISLRRWEHVGSYEWLWKGMKECSLRFYRTGPELKHTASDIPRFRTNGAHGGYRGYSPDKIIQSGTAMFHYSYTRRDLAAKFLYNASRHDWTDEEWLGHKRRIELYGPLGWLPKVEPVPYGQPDVPLSMKPFFDNTYELAVMEDGQITGRTNK